MIHEHKPGTLYHAIVDGQDCCVYLSLTCEGKGSERKDHCLRYAPPSNLTVVDKDGNPVCLRSDGTPNYSGMTIGAKVETKRTRHGKDYQKG